jgi:hypothetical protein
MLNIIPIITDDRDFSNFLSTREHLILFFSFDNKHPPINVQNKITASCMPVIKSALFIRLVQLIKVSINPITT